mmetsp:Transcript_9142/g.40126  ORF Transcript_9142/g.40126 Transcript_9142/m.40126 type:complete len:203 (+) Transcript_9142:668-1276(+)
MSVSVSVVPCFMHEARIENEHLSVFPKPLLVSDLDPALVLRYSKGEVRCQGKVSVISVGFDPRFRRLSREEDLRARYFMLLKDLHSVLEDFRVFWLPYAPILKYERSPIRSIGHCLFLHSLSPSARLSHCQQLTIDYLEQLQEKLTVAQMLLPRFSNDFCFIHFSSSSLITSKSFSKPCAHWYSSTSCQFRASSPAMNDPAC